MSATKPPDPESVKAALAGGPHGEFKLHGDLIDEQREIKLEIFDALKSWLRTGGEQFLAEANQKAKSIREVRS